MTNSAASNDPMEFFKTFWGNMGFPLPGMVTPTLDTDELGRRIADLKAVEGWLKTNLSMLQMTIQGLEMQRATLAAMRAMSETANPQEPAAANPFANPALWQWPFMAQSEAAAEPAAEAPEPKAAEETASARPARAAKPKKKPQP